MGFGTTTCETMASSSVCTQSFAYPDLLYFGSWILFAQFIIVIGLIFNTFMGKTK